MLLTMEFKLSDGTIEVPESIHKLPCINLVKYVFSQHKRNLKAFVNNILVAEYNGEEAVLLWQIANGEKQNNIILTESQVKRIASEVCYVSLDDMINLKRGVQDVVFGRWLVWHYFKRYKPLRHLQLMFGNKRNHATILHSFKIMNDHAMMSRDMINYKTEFYNRINKATLDQQDETKKVQP